MVPLLREAGKVCKVTDDDDNDDDDDDDDVGDTVGLNCSRGRRTMLPLHQEATMTTMITVIMIT